MLGFQPNELLQGHELLWPGQLLRSPDKMSIDTFQTKRSYKSLDSIKKVCTSFPIPFTFMFASIVDGRPSRQLQAAVPGQRRVGRAVDALDMRVDSQGWFAWKPYSTRPTEDGSRGRGPSGRELAQR